MTAKSDVRWTVTDCQVGPYGSVMLAIGDGRAELAPEQAEKLGNALLDAARSATVGADKCTVCGYYFYRNESGVVVHPDTPCFAAAGHAFVDVTEEQ